MCHDVIISIFISFAFLILQRETVASYSQTPPGCIWSSCKPPQQSCPEDYTEMGSRRCNCRQFTKSILCCKDSSDDDDKIVGGVQASSAQFPHQVSIRFTLSPGHHGLYCGGTIYSAIYIVTAAHCTYHNKMEGNKDVSAPISPDMLTVVAGDYSLKNKDEYEQTIKVLEIIRHENHTTKKRPSDIALLKLASPIQFNKGVNIIKMAPTQHKASGMAIVSGWGSTEEAVDPYPDTLRYTNVSIVSDEDCRGAYTASNIQDSMVCAQYPGHDSCQGDSGGPLICNDLGYWYLCGIVSFGRGCAESKYPGVYTEVSYFTQWIDTKVVH